MTKYDWPGNILYGVWCSALDSQANNFVENGKVGKASEKTYLRYQSNILEKAKSQLIKKFEEREQALLEELQKALPERYDREAIIKAPRHGAWSMNGYNECLDTVRNLIKERLK